MATPARALRSFAFFALLVFFWSAFFGAFKLYCWSVFAGGHRPSLELIAGYLSFGGIFAYLAGGALARTFYRRSLLLLCAACALALVGLLWAGAGASPVGFALVLAAVGFFYSLWAVLKNILISVEIDRTGLSDAVVTGVANIVFIVAVILGTVTGPILAERLGHAGFGALATCLAIAFALALPLDYEPGWHVREMLSRAGFWREKALAVSAALRDSIPNVRRVIARYGIIVLCVTLLWALTTVVSQKSVEISREIFGKSESEAALLLLYSSVGAVAGNVASMGLRRWRWVAFQIANALFAGLVLALPTVIALSVATGSYAGMIAVAVGMGTFFGIASNLVEGYYFLRLAEDDEKEYGAVAYGFALSVMLTLSMFASAVGTSFVGHVGALYGIGAVVAVIGPLVAFGRKTASAS